MNIEADRFQMVNRLLRPEGGCLMPTDIVR